MSNYLNYKTKRLKYCKYGQCKARVYDNGDVVLQSYNTDIIKKCANGNILCSGCYSNTTMKHMKAFCDEYNIDYYKVKKNITHRGYLGFRFTVEDK